MDLAAWRSPHPIFRISASQRPKEAELKRLTSRFSLGPTSWKIMAGFPKVRMLELELFQCLNRQLGYAGRLGVVAVELPLPARGSQTVGANCDQALWFCPFGFQSVMPTLLSPSGYGTRGDHAAGPLRSKSCFSGFEVSRRKGSWQRSSLTCRAAERATRAASQFYALRPRTALLHTSPHPPEHELRRDVG